MASLPAKRVGVTKSFSPQTLKKFEDASASIPLRQLDRAFTRASIPLGTDPDDALGGGSRRIQFRRYVASLNQADVRDLERLGDALGALLAEVATSKIDFLVRAAEVDGFSFADGVFRLARTDPNVFAVTRLDTVASIEARGKRLQLLANDEPKDAVAGARELVLSVCRTISTELGEPMNETDDLGEAADATLAILGRHRSDGGDENENDVGAVSHRSLRQLAAIVETFNDARTTHGGRDRSSDGALSSRDARLVVGVALAFAAYLTETYLEPSADR